MQQHNLCLLHKCDIIVDMVMQVYKDDGSSTMIFADGTIKVYTEYEEWVIDQIVREYEDSDQHYRTPRPHELAEIFPEAKTYLNERRKEIAVLLNELLEDDRKIEADLELRKIKNKELREHKLALNEIRRNRLITERAENDTILSFMNPRKSKGVQNFQMELSKAKGFPIDKLLPFTRNKTKCIWHTDKDPSLYYYRKDNRVHCFACGKGGDAVDVAMQMKGLSIGDAIGFLNQTTT